MIVLKTQIEIVEELQVEEREEVLVEEAVVVEIGVTEMVIEEKEAASEEVIGQEEEVVVVGVDIDGATLQRKLTTRDSLVNLVPEGEIGQTVVATGTVEIEVTGAIEEIEGTAIVEIVQTDLVIEVVAEEVAAAEAVEGVTKTSLATAFPRFPPTHRFRPHHEQCAAQL